MNYGFLVIPSEIRQRGYLEEGMDGTVFVEVDTYEWPHMPGKVLANLYYKRNFAKSNRITEEELRARFPKSFAKGDAGEEYNKLPK